MKTSTTAILILVTAALGFGAGYRVALDRTPPFETPEARPRPPARPAGEAGNRVTAVLSQPASIDRAAEFVGLLRELGPDAIGEAQSAMESLPVDVGELPSALFATWWAQFEPDAAFAWVRKRRPFSKLTHSMTIREWARNDPTAAAQASTGIPGTDLRLAVYRNLAFGWAESKAPGLDDFLENISNPGEQQMTVEAYVRWKVENEGSESAIAWAEAVPADSGTIKSSAVQRVGKEVGRIDPLRAAAFAEKHADEEYGWLVYRFVGQSWATQDGPAAMAWLASLPDGRERERAVDVAFRAWLSTDQEAAKAWAFGVADEDWFQPGLTAYAAIVAQSDRARGLAIAAKIPEEGSRSSVMGSLLRGWLAADREAAQAWIDQHELPQDTLDRAYKPMPKPRAPRGQSK
jgi:hypothetical protein